MTLVQDPSIEVVKTASTLLIDPVAAGATVDYSYTITNSGNVTLTGVTLTDDQEGSIDLSATTLTPGASATGSATHTVTQAEIDAGTLTNVATTIGTPPAGPGSNVTASDTQTVTLVQDPSIEVVKALSANADEDGSGDVSLGDTLTYSFTVTNTGNVTLANVSVSDPLPGLSAATGGASTLAPGASTVFTATYTVTQANVDAGQVSNTAIATGTPPSGPNVSDTDTVTVDVTHIAWQVTKVSIATQVPSTVVNNVSISAGNSTATGSASTTDTVVVASDVTYAITITNLGDGNAVNVVLVDNLPAGVTITGNPDGGTVSGNTVTWDLGNVAAGASVTVSVTVRTQTP